MPEKGTLYTHGDRDSDMFVVLDGEIEVVLRSLNGGYKVFAHHRRHQFSGELSLLNSQTAVTEASALEVFVGLRGVRREKLILQGLACRMGLGGPVDERGYFVNHPPFLAPRWSVVRLADYTSSGSFSDGGPSDQMAGARTGERYGRFIAKHCPKLQFSV